MLIIDIIQDTCGSIRNTMQIPRNMPAVTVVPDIFRDIIIKIRNKIIWVPT